MGLNQVEREEFTYCILKLACTSFVYLVWKERNQRKFRGLSSNEQLIVINVKRVVQIRLQGRGLFFFFFFLSISISFKAREKLKSPIQSNQERTETRKLT